MRHLFLTDCFPPPLEGGSVVFLHNLISHLPPEDVLVLTNARPGQEPFDRAERYRIVRSGIPWHGFGKAWQARVVLRWARLLSALLRRERFDLVHAGDFFLSGVTAWWTWRRKKIPYVLYAYAEELNCQLKRRDRFWGALKGRVYRRLARDAAGMVVVSDYTASLLEQFGAPREKILKIVPMVAPGAEVAPEGLREARRRWNLPEGEKVIFTAGRMIERKGQDKLIEALPEVLERVPGARLLVAGRGPEEERLRALAAGTGVGDRVVFAGFVPDEELPALFELCDVFAMPHRELPNGDTEGCPTVFLEAGAHGKPVVGGRVGGVRDAILDGETGLIVDGEQTGQIARALVRLLADPALARRLGENGRRRVLEELAPERGAKRLIEYCHTILSGGAAA